MLYLKSIYSGIVVPSTKLWPMGWEVVSFQEYKEWVLSNHTYFSDEWGNPVPESYHTSH